jgi:crotonobetainyl-CoA:carnitine CoA-transferase CaiB-like acyl-CoA transferase
MSGALQGIKILDLSRVLAGPYCTMILGDLGAEVIKVEAPGGSDDTRQWGPPSVGGESAYYLCANRNKRAITLDLKSKEGQEVLKKLIAQSDVMLQNFKTGTLEKWGLGYEQIKQINPRIVQCSITGFGSNGPYKDLPGYDYIIQAMGGLMGITGSEESGPMKVGVAIADVLTGLYAAIGILSALHERNLSGEGQSIDLSLFDTQVSSLANVASNFLISGMLPKRLGNQHPNIVPYQTFQTLDGEMVVAVGNDRQFKKLCNVLDLREIGEDERFSTNPKRLERKDELIPIISNVMNKKASSEWLELLSQHGVPCGPINTMQQLFDDPQVKAREMVVDVNHPTAGSIPLVGSPLKLSRTPVEMKRHPPLAGEHNKEVLLELGYTEEELDELLQKRVI